MLALAFVIAACLAVLKLTVPFSYAEAELRPPAIQFVVGLQASGAIDPKECAARYLYFQSDYHSEVPGRIEVTIKTLSDGSVRVTFRDPSCRDDSVHSSIDRIYLQRSDAGIWVPNLHEWSHTGRGTFGWTTEPAN